MFYNETHKRWQFAETHWSDKFKPISQVYDESRREHIATIIRAASNVITTQQTNPITAFRNVLDLTLVDFPGKHRDDSRIFGSTATPPKEQSYTFTMQL
jgi:hypothetical protein